MKVKHLQCVVELAPLAFIERSTLTLGRKNSRCSSQLDHDRRRLVVDIRVGVSFLFAESFGCTVSAEPLWVSIFA